MPSPLGVLMDLFLFPLAVLLLGLVWYRLPEEPVEGLPWGVGGFFMTFTADFIVIGPVSNNAAPTVVYYTALR